MNTTKRSTKTYLALALATVMATASGCANKTHNHAMVDDEGNVIKSEEGTKLTGAWSQQNANPLAPNMSGTYETVNEMTFEGLKGKRMGQPIGAGSAVEQIAAPVVEAAKIPAYYIGARAMRRTSKADETQAEAAKEYSQAAKDGKLADQISVSAQASASPVVSATAAPVQIQGQSQGQAQDQAQAQAQGQSQGQSQGQGQQITAPSTPKPTTKPGCKVPTKHR